MKFLNETGLAHLWEKIKSTLSGKADKSHTHTKSDITNFDHTHDERYYTENEIDDKLETKSDSTHTHDDRYYTETEVDNKLKAKVDNADFTKHVDDTNVHITTEERTKWDNKSDFSGSYTDLTNKPLKLSEFTNDEGFITNTVNNLTNYYKKNDIDNLLSNLHKLDVEKITDFPANPSTTTIYLKAKTEAQERNIFDEYLYIDGKWETIGDTKVDLSNYYDKTEIDNKLKTKANLTHTHTKSDITDFEHTHIWSEVTGKPETFTPSTHTHDDRYYTENEIDTKLKTKSDSSHIHDNATSSSSGFMSSTDKAKLDTIASGANKTVVDDALNTSSTNPVQNKVIAGEFAKYLPLAGGTMTDTINSNVNTTTYLAGSQGTSIINTPLSKPNYVALWRVQSTNGVFTISKHANTMKLVYMSDSTISAGTNSPTHQVTLLDESGNATFPNTVTATTFSGNATGLVCKSVADADLNKTTGTFAFKGTSAASNSNYPATGSDWAGLQIDAGNDTLQIVAMNGSIAVRQNDSGINTNGTGWTAWKTLLGTGDNAASASKLGSSDVGSSTKPIYLSKGTATACSGIVVPGIKSAGGATDSGWGTNNNYVPDMSFIAYWNGKYNASNSNLQYCKNGEIVGTTGTQTISGAKTFSSTISGSVNGTASHLAPLRSQNPSAINQVIKIGTFTMSGQADLLVLTLYGGDGQNNQPNQNTTYRIHIKKGWQSTASATNAFGTMVEIFAPKSGDAHPTVTVRSTSATAGTVYIQFPFGYPQFNYEYYESAGTKYTHSGANGTTADLTAGSANQVDYITYASSSTFGSYLPLAGGTMSGPITFDSKNNRTKFMGIKYWSSDYYNWATYMAQNDTTATPSGGKAQSYGNVTSWAMRNYIENGSGYGWIWESSKNEANATPTPMMALSSADGSLTVKGNVTAPNFSGNATSATKLQTTRAIKLDGSYLSGSVSFNGSADVTLTATPVTPVNGKQFQGFVTIRPDGVMEAGKYIDFHHTATSTNDYDTRLQTTAANKNTVNLPSASGTLALTSDIKTYPVRRNIYEC